MHLHHPLPLMHLHHQLPLLNLLTLLHLQNLLPLLHLLSTPTPIPTPPHSHPFPQRFPLQAPLTSDAPLFLLVKRGSWNYPSVSFSTTTVVASSVSCCLTCPNSMHGAKLNLRQKKVQEIGVFPRLLGKSANMLFLQLHNF